jgi:hypothetical protein
MNDLLSFWDGSYRRKKSDQAPWIWPVSARELKYRKSPVVATDIEIQFVHES